MKILYHHRTKAEDAQGIHIFEMVEAFQNQGHSVKIVSLIKDSLEKNKKESHKNLFYKLKFPNLPQWIYELFTILYNFYGYFKFRNVILGFKPNLIYERYSLNTFCGIWVSRNFNIPLILEVNLPLVYELTKFGKLKFKSLARFSEKWICSNSTVTIVVSHEMKRYFIKEGVPEGNIVVMHNGINPSIFNKTVSGKNIRTKFSINKSTVVIGFVGWFREWHGLEKLIDLINEIKVEDIKLLLVGDGPTFTNLSNLVENYQLHSKVIFTHAIERKDLPEYIAGMDIALLPQTNTYGCPMKLSEYMAMGKCILAPDIPVIREIIENHKTGILFKNGDMNDLKVKILTLVKDQNLRKTLGDNAYEDLFLRGYLWSENAKKSIKLISPKVLE